MEERENENRYAFIQYKLYLRNCNLELIIESTHSSNLDVVVTENIITARPNGYVDFAIEVAKKMDLFEDEDDLKETIAFWRDHQRME